MFSTSVTFVYFSLTSSISNTYLKVSMWGGLDGKRKFLTFKLRHRFIRRSKGLRPTSLSLLERIKLTHFRGKIPELSFKQLLGVKPDIKPAESLWIASRCVWNQMPLTLSSVLSAAVETAVTLLSFCELSAVWRREAVVVQLIVCFRWRRKWQLNNNTTFIRLFDPEQQEVNFGQNRWFGGLTGVSAELQVDQCKCRAEELCQSISRYEKRSVCVCVYITISTQVFSSCHSNISLWEEGEKRMLS